MPQTPAALVDLVAPPDLATGGVTPPSPTSERLRAALLNVNRYALHTLYPGRPVRGTSPPDSPRAAGGEALALAASLATGAYDPRRVGYPIAHARAVAVWLVASEAHAHAAVTLGGWGAGDDPVPADLHSWPSPLAATELGTAGWLLWPDLDFVARHDVAAMVVNEADRLLPVGPNYYATPRGRVLHRGDTKAEEDAWVSGILALAPMMLPRHPHAAAWRVKEAAFETAAFSTAADDTSHSVVNGRTLRSWLAGWNVFPDGTLVNHHLFPHPDYMAEVSLSLSAGVPAALADRPVLVAALHNAPLIYCSLLSRPFPSPPGRPPGGTIYRPGSGDIYYPSGDDWGTSLVAQFVLLDTEAAAFGLSRAAPDELRLHLDHQLAEQARSPDGRTFQSPQEYGYAEREEWVGEHLGRAWLIAWGSAAGRLSLTDDAL